MPTQVAIPALLEGEILEKAAQGLTSRQITVWLAETHGVTADHTTVARYLAKHREERADVTKAVIRQKLAKTVTADLDILAKHVAKLDRMADSNEHDPRVYCKAVEQLRKVVDTRLHYAGGDAPEGSQSLADFFASTFSPRSGEDDDVEE